MAFDLIPRYFLDFPSKLPSFFDDSEWASYMPSSGLSVYEDEKNVYVDAAVPGVDPDKIEVTYDQGILWVRGSQEENEEDKNKKFYRKAARNFSYRISIPGNIDEGIEPQAVYKNGVMKIIFTKQSEIKPKKISVRKE